MVQLRTELGKTDSQPGHSAPYCTGPKARNFDKQEIYSMLTMDDLKPMQTELRSPTVIFFKKEESFRFSVNYLKLNAMTIWDSYTMSLMDECMDWLGTETIFSTLDENCSYWQVKMAERHRDKTAFSSHHGHSPFICIPFELKSPQGLFNKQRTST